MSNRTSRVELKLGDYQMFVGRPSSYRPNKFVCDDILKPGLFQPAFKERTGAWLHARCFRDSEELAVEFVKGSIGSKGAIWGGYFDIKVNALNITSWYCESGMVKIRRGAENRLARVKLTRNIGGLIWASL